MSVNSVFIDSSSGNHRAISTEIFSSETAAMVSKTQQATALLRFYLDAGDMLCLERKLVAEVAAEKVKDVTGLDISHLLTQQYLSQAALTVTMLGERVGLTGAEINLRLQEYGFQVKYRKKWTPTAKASSFFTQKPYESIHPHLESERIFWYPKILVELGLS